VSVAPGVLARAGLAGLADVRAEQAAARANAIAPYRLDPLRPVREGRIPVWDPDARAVVPWRIWPNQEESILAWIDVDMLAEGRLKLRKVHVEKSRQEGDTTAFAYAALWVLTYWPVPLFMQHADLDRVADSGFTYNSFFGKIKLLHDHWPAEIGRAPLAFIGGNRPLIRRTDMSVGYMVGAGQSADAARTGRYAGAIIDEAARITRDRQVRAAMSAAVPEGEVQLSTPNGEGNVYFELRETRPHGWTFLRHHWTDHPIYARGLHIAGSLPGECHRCDGVLSDVPYDPHEDETHRFPGKPTSDWYEDAIRDLTNEEVAQELDIDYTASLTARVYAEFDETIHVVREPIAWDPALRTEVAWDYGVAPTAGVICQESPMEQRVIGDFEVYDATPEIVDRVLRDELRALGVDERTLALPESFLCVGDPSGQQRQQTTARPLTSDYAELGWNIISQPAFVSSTINSVKRMLAPGQPKPLRVSPRAWRFIRHIKANRWRTDSRGQRIPDGPLDNDEHNHMMRAFAYLIHFKWPWVEDDVEEALSLARREAYEAEHTGRLTTIGYDFEF
jgi:hypothetical protein